MSDSDLQSIRSIWPSVAVGGKLGRARTEWLHTNGAGAYASSTLGGMHTRRYHGLLVAALEAPRRRHVLLSHIDTAVTRMPAEGDTKAERWELSKHQFPGIDPEYGPFYLERFDQDPLPRWTYALPLGRLEVTLGLVRGANAVVLRYVWTGEPAVLLTLRPLLAAREFHKLQREHGGMLQRVELRPGEVRVQPVAALPRVCFSNTGTFVGSPDWWRRFEYLLERDRGLEFQEDLWTPGVFELEVGEEPRYFVVSADRLPEGEPAAHLEEAARAVRAEDPGPEHSPLRRRLTIAAADFRADLASPPGIVAGYPWFEVWGRDSLIALPGLYLVQGRHDAAVSVLRGLLAHQKGGLIPNRVPDEDKPVEYHAADATLWLFEAARLLVERVGVELPFVEEELFPALKAAFEAVLAGTTSNIHVTDEGLFAAGNAGDSVTWMDARVDGRAVTSRAGCPVELTALWARACDTLAELARKLGEPDVAARASVACARARAGFALRFWCTATNYPYDVVSERSDGPDAFADKRVRPNAVIALAVDPACFTPEQAGLLLSRAEDDLVTPAGLRSLAPSEPGYLGSYGGGVAQRDRAYHQGSAWSWLLGSYARAMLAAAGDDPHVQAGLLRLVESAASRELAVGQVAELADGDAPHAPNGCVAQAWSVAELLRILAWDLPQSKRAGEKASASEAG